MSQQNPYRPPESPALPKAHDKWSAARNLVVALIVLQIAWALWNASLMLELARQGVISLLSLAGFFLATLFLAGAARALWAQSRRAIPLSAVSLLLMAPNFIQLGSVFFGFSTAVPLIALAVSIALPRVANTSPKA